jgi:tetratricopeptide (TPR) repeat protein
LYELRKATANEDVTFIEGKCLSYSTNVAYHPVIDLLKSTFDIQEGDDDSRIRDRVKGGLKDMGIDEDSALPFVLELLSVRDSGIDALGLTPEARKARTLEALRRIVLKGSEMRPLVLAIEDLHWVDNSSEDTLKSLLEAISGAQVLLLFTYRPEFVHTWGAKSYHSQVNLLRLSNRETLAMAAHILGTEGIEGTLEELILEKTEGIPFFVEEFMKSLKDLGMIEWRDSGYYLAKDIKDVAIPSTIQDVIMARVDSLPEGAKNVLQTGSAIGREFSCELIKRVTGVPQPEITPHLSALRDSELLYERGIFPQATYIFRHALTQEVAYDSLLQKRKQEMHNRIAQAIEELYPERLEELYEALAHHYARSDKLEKAYLYLRLSGEKATRQFSNSEACHFYREAINILGRMPETGENRRRVVEVLLLMEGPMKLLGYPDGSLQLLQEGERLAAEQGDDRALAIIYASMGLCHTFKGDSSQGMRYAEYCFEMAERIEDIELLAPTAFDLCSSYAILGDFTKTIQVAPRVLTLLEKTGREWESFGVAFNFNVYSALSSYCGQALGFLGDFEKGEALCEKGLRFAQRIDNVYSVGFAEMMYGLLLFVKGDGSGAVEHLHHALACGEEGEIIPVVGMACGALGWGYLLLGELESARAHLERGLQVQRDAGLAMLMSLHNVALGMVYFESGDVERARACIEDALESARNNGEKWAEGMAWVCLGRVLGKSDRPQYEKAEECILHGIRHCDDVGMRPPSAQGHIYLGELYADTGRTDAARRSLKKAEGMCRDMGMDYWQAKAQRRLATLQA